MELFWQLRANPETLELRIKAALTLHLKYFQVLRLNKQTTD